MGGDVRRPHHVNQPQADGGRLVGSGRRPRLPDRDIADGIALKTNIRVAHVVPGHRSARLAAGAEVGDQRPAGRVVNGDGARRIGGHRHISGHGIHRQRVDVGIVVAGCGRHLPLGVRQRRVGVSRETHQPVLRIQEGRAHHVDPARLVHRRIERRVIQVATRAQRDDARPRIICRQGPARLKVPAHHPLPARVSVGHPQLPVGAVARDKERTEQPAQGVVVVTHHVGQRVGCDLLVPRHDDAVAARVLPVEPVVLPHPGPEWALAECARPRVSAGAENALRRRAGVGVELLEAQQVRRIRGTRARIRIGDVNPAIIGAVGILIHGQTARRVRVVARIGVVGGPGPELVSGGGGGDAESVGAPGRRIGGGVLAVPDHRVGAAARPRFAPGDGQGANHVGIGEDPDGHPGRSGLVEEIADAEGLPGGDDHVGGRVVQPQVGGVNVGARGGRHGRQGQGQHKAQDDRALRIWFHAFVITVLAGVIKKILVRSRGKRAGLC